MKKYRIAWSVAPSMQQFLSKGELLFFFINNSVTQHHFFLSHPAYQGDDLLKLCRSFPDETHTCCVIAFSVSSQINAWFSRKDRNESQGHRPPVYHFSLCWTPLVRCYLSTSANFANTPSQTEHSAFGSLVVVAPCSLSSLDPKSGRMPH